MKELSIEEKAKAYDKVLEWATEAHKVCDGMLKEDLEHLFPELRESDDEMIRKEIVNFICWATDRGSITSEQREKSNSWLAWLEKQGEQKQPKELTNSEFVEKCKGLSRLEQHILALVPTRPIDAIKVDARTIRYLVEQEQGERNPNPCDGCINRKGCINCENGELREVEQKPADNVEPNFRKGDWVVYCNDDVDLITSIEENGYTINEGGYIPFVCASDIRLWTIQDAKDGDVLAVELIEGYSSSFVAIYKKQNEEDFDSYCFVGFDGKFYDGENGHSMENIHPATKEQCDLLFQKMKEAGYEWCAEKKELKKIEQKPVEWRPIDNEYMTKLCEIIDGYDAERQWKGAIKDWLKSLKDRCLPQPREEWTMQDEEELQIALDTLVKAGQHSSAKWLKNVCLIPQNTWKPSEEQMQAVEEALSLAKNCGEDYSFDLRKLLEQLKAL